MMRNLYGQQLAALNGELAEMGGLCEQAIATVGKALATGDVGLARSVAAVDTEIDRKEHDIEALCLRLLLMQQPVAGDLRQVSAALKMITDMERIGDQAYDIAEITEYLGGRVAEECCFIGDMARETVSMVTGSVDAYIQRDPQMAREVIAQDDTVDALFHKVKRSLIALIAAAPEQGEYALDLLMIAKYFERIGDHATNIAEWAVYSVTGVHAPEEEHPGI